MKNYKDYKVLSKPHSYGEYLHLQNKYEALEAEHIRLKDEYGQQQLVVKYYQDFVSRNSNVLFAVPESDQGSPVLA
jgi:hypothetical protein